MGLKDVISLAFHEVDRTAWHRLVCEISADFMNVIPHDSGACRAMQVRVTQIHIVAKPTQRRVRQYTHTFWICKSHIFPAEVYRKPRMGYPERHHAQSELDVAFPRHVTSFRTAGSPPARSCSCSAVDRSFALKDCKVLVKAVQAFGKERCAKHLIRLKTKKGTRLACDVFYEDKSKQLRTAQHVITSHHYMYMYRPCICCVQAAEEAPVEEEARRADQ